VSDTHIVASFTRPPSPLLLEIDLPFSVFSCEWLNVSNGSLSLLTKPSILTQLSTLAQGDARVRAPPHFPPSLHLPIFSFLLPFFFDKLGLGGHPLTTCPPFFFHQSPFLVNLPLALPFPNFPGKGQGSTSRQGLFFFWQVNSFVTRSIVFLFFSNFFLRKSFFFFRCLKNPVQAPPRFSRLFFDALLAGRNPLMANRTKFFLPLFGVRLFFFLRLSGWVLVCSRRAPRNISYVPLGFPRWIFFNLFLPRFGNPIVCPSLKTFFVVTVPRTKILL